MSSPHRRSQAARLVSRDAGALREASARARICSAMTNLTALPARPSTAVRDREALAVTTCCRRWQPRQQCPYVELSLMRQCRRQLAGKIAEQKRSPLACCRSAASRYEVRRLCGTEQRGLALRGSPAKRSPAASSSGRLSSSSALLSVGKPLERLHSNQAISASAKTLSPGYLRHFGEGKAITKLPSAICRR